MASREYRAENKGEDEKTLLIEHPLRQGWKLVDTPTPVETTPTLYRFEGKAPAGKMTKLVVREELVTNESMMVMNMDLGMALTYSRTGALPADVREALGRAMRARQDIADTEKQMNDRVQRLAGITQEQARIREDMKTVAPTTSYYTRLLAKLNEQESTIERLQHERDELSARRDRQRRELEEYLADLTIG